MQTLAERISCSTLTLALAAVLCICLGANAQDSQSNPLTPGVSNAGPATAPGTMPGTTVQGADASGAAQNAAGAAGAAAAPAAADSTTDKPPGDATGEALDYFYNRKPQEGTAAMDAAAANQRATDRANAADALGLTTIPDAQVRDRFEKYLNAAEVPTAQLTQYTQGMNAVAQMLDSGQTVQAWKSLNILAEYTSIDAGVSKALADRIDAIWNVDRASNNLDLANQKLLGDIRSTSRNADLLSEQVRQDDLEYQRRAIDVNKAQNLKGRNGIQTQPQYAANGNQTQQQLIPGADTAPTPPSAATVTSMAGRLQLAEDYMDTVEGRTKMKVNEVREEALYEQSKTDFQKYIDILFQSGRQQHVVLAANFYRKLFDEDTYPTSIAQDVNSAMAASNDVQSAVDVFRYKVDKGEIAGATAQLQNAFQEGEYHPAVLGLERSYKEKVASYDTKLNKIENMIEAHDYGSIQPLVADIQREAPDFDSTKVMALVTMVKLESSLRLGKAKIAAQQGDMKTAMDEIRAAAEEWPGNPDLQNNAGAFFDSQDLKSQSTTEFDRLYAEGNYRAIFDKQLVFAPAIHGDSKREDQLKGALEKITKAEMATEKADMLREAGDVYGAWEAIDAAVKDLPSDIKLNNMLAELSGKGAEFVSLINKARDAEARGDEGYSLTWYAIAQRYYPASSIANDGILRMSKSILEKGNQASPL